MNTNDAEFNRQYEKLEKILQHYKQFYGDELWWDQGFCSLNWSQINKEYIKKCWIFPEIEVPTCSCICPPATYHPVSKIILELIFKENMIVVNLTCGKVKMIAQYVGDEKLYTSCSIGSGDNPNISINLKDEDFDDYLVAYGLMEDVLKSNEEKEKLVSIHKKRFYVLKRKEQMEKDFDD